MFLPVLHHLICRTLLVPSISRVSVIVCDSSARFLGVLTMSSDTPVELVTGADTAPDSSHGVNHGNGRGNGGRGNSGRGNGGRGNGGRGNGGNGNGRGNSGGNGGGNGGRGNGRGNGGNGNGRGNSRGNGGGNGGGHGRGNGGNGGRGNGGRGNSRGNGGNGGRGNSRGNGGRGNGHGGSDASHDNSGGGGATRDRPRRCNTISHTEFPLFGFLTDVFNSETMCVPVGAEKIDGKNRVFLPSVWYTRNARACCAVAGALGALAAATDDSTVGYLSGALSTVPGYPHGNFSQVAEYYTAVAHLLKGTVVSAKIPCVDTALRLLVSTASL